MLRNSIILLSTLVLSSACAPKPAKLSPREEAVLERVMEANPTLEHFTFTDFRIVDSVSLSQELERRTRLFLTKEKVEQRSTGKFESKGMPTNAEKHRREVREARRVLKALEKYRMTHAPQLDSIIYYVVEFSGYGSTVDKVNMQVSGMQAAVSPNDSVYQLKAPEENIFTGMGRAIPGYLNIIKRK